mmetsp:Transcript_14205/g.42115  ORF Transcript_14205/g.42115 Transcript_14205/m.42115 type:complete len:323 (+) Transcript_14205:2373-3341(+)
MLLLQSEHRYLGVAQLTRHPLVRGCVIGCRLLGRRQLLLKLRHPGLRGCQIAFSRTGPGSHVGNRRPKLLFDLTRLGELACGSCCLRMGRLGCLGACAESVPLGLQHLELLGELGLGRRQLVDLSLLFGGGNGSVAFGRRGGSVDGFCQPTLHRRRLLPHRRHLIGAKPELVRMLLLLLAVLLSEAGHLFVSTRLRRRAQLCGEGVEHRRWLSNLDHPTLKLFKSSASVAQDSLHFVFVALRENPPLPLTFFILLVQKDNNLRKLRHFLVKSVFNGSCHCDSGTRLSVVGPLVATERLWCGEWQRLPGYTHSRRFTTRRRWV